MDVTVFLKHLSIFLLLATLLVSNGVLVGSQSFANAGRFSTLEKLSKSFPDPSQQLGSLQKNPTAQKPLPAGRFSTLENLSKPFTDQPMWGGLQKTTAQKTAIKEETISPFKQAIIDENIDAVKKFCDKGADVNQHIQGYPIINLAIRKNNVELVKLLIDKGADVRQISSRSPPLNLAAAHGNLEIVKLLIDKGANVNAKEKVKRNKRAQCIC